jgi:hypothetical protein
MPFMPAFLYKGFFYFELALRPLNISAFITVLSIRRVAPTALRNLLPY